MSVIRKLDRDPIVAFHVAYAKLPGSDPVCALFLSQVSYWCSRAEDGVAWITHQAMYDQTGMSRKQQDRAAAYWESVGVMNKFIKGIPPKIHYFIDYERLELFLMEEPDGQVNVSERDILDVQNGQHVMSERDKTSSKDSRDSQRVSEDQQQAAPEPAAPEKVKTKSQSSTVREQELAQKLLDIWNSACDRAKLTRSSLPKCLKFPVDAMPAMKKYMKAYTDDEIIQLVTDGSRSVQKNDFYHERRYGFVNLMRNLGANANLSAPAERSADAPDGASPIPVAPSPKSSVLFDFDQDEAAAERKKLLDYEASLPVPEFPC